MIRRRWPLLLVMGVASLALAYLLRDVVYQVIIVPVAYVLWLLHIVYISIPQWVLWALLVAVLFLVVLWNLVPEIRFAGRKEPLRPRAQGEVEALVVWIRKARRGNYFRWQLANRLGRIARRLNELSGPHGRQVSQDSGVEEYLDAGMNYSFVDFLAPGSRFQRQPRTPLDVDPGRVADYLESQMESASGRRS